MNDSDENQVQALEGELISANPTPGKPEAKVPRRIDLSTLRDVRLELAALYRRVDSGELESADGTKRAFILGKIADVIRLAEIEARLDALEEREAAGGKRTLPAPTYAH